MDWGVDLRQVIGLGVAGNFTGHLEQAGEASDFVDVEVRDAAAPKGVFPFYVPGAEGKAVGRYPISHDRLRIPSPDDRLQLEPELGLLCELVYGEGGVAAVVPRRFGAYNDCSIRREGAKKISEKKNWGADSKGVAVHSFAIDRFSAGGEMDHFRIACYLERAGELHAYGVDSAITSYSYFHERLLDWLVERLNHQVDEGPLECIADWLAVAGHPATALISVGATRYTDFGETHFLEPGDRSLVAVYDGREHDADGIRALIRDSGSAPSVSLLDQKVEG